MKRPVSMLAALAALAVIAPSADAAAPKCTRGGAEVLATSGNASVVSITPKSKDDSAEAKIYGCWIPNGKRFQLFKGDLSSDEATTWSISDGRYIGVDRTLMGGVGGGASFANSWDARKRVALYDTKPCDGVLENPDADETGAGGTESVLFLRGGGIAYTCDGNMISHIVDAKGDRLLEPNGTVVTSFAVTPSGDRLYYMAGETAKTVAL